MAKPRRTTEEEWYDVFSRWDVEGQAIAIRVLEQIHRIAKRGPKPQPTEEPGEKLDLRESGK